MNRRSFSEFFKVHGLTALGLLLILVFNFSIRWHLREMPLERDEGEYAYVGQLILQGIPPYQLAYNMKFPGVYFAYAALMKCFGESPQGIHFGIILVTSVSAIFVFLIGRELLGAIGGLMTAATFVCLSALPTAFGLAGHATHFVTLFVCAGTFALLKAEKKTSLYWPLVAGTAIAMAVLMKQHGIIFLPFAVGWLVWQLFRQKKPAFRQSALSFVIFFAGFAIPLLLAVGALFYAGVWDHFYFWTIQYARQYVSILPLRFLPRQFIDGFEPVLDSGICVWIFGVAGIGLLFLRTERRHAAVIGAGLFLAGMAAACPGFYFRGHYFLTAMPGLSLLNATLILAIADKLRKPRQIRVLRLLPVCLFCIVTGGLIVRNFQTWFSLTPYEVSRAIYGSSPFPESAEIAKYLAAHTSPSETISVLGSEPQIYFLARRHSASGYIYVYSLTEPQPLGPAMREEFLHQIETAMPQYIVCVRANSSWYLINVPNETRQIFNYFSDWWSGYSQNYQMVGAVDIFKDKPSEFFWDEQLANRTNSSPPAISIFLKK